MTDKTPSKLRRPEDVSAELDRIREELMGQQITVIGHPAYEAKKAELDRVNLQVAALKQLVKGKRVEIAKLEEELGPARKQLNAIQASIELRRRELKMFESTLQTLVD